MQYFSNEISTGYAVNAAFMSYVENETVTDILQNSPDWKVFREEYDKGYGILGKMLGESFPAVDSLLNNLRAMHDLESELFYRVGIHDGVSICNGNFILQNIGGAE